MSFWKYYLLRKPKLVLTIILAIVIYIWISRIYSVQMDEYSSRQFALVVDEGIYIYYIKPLFVFLAALVVINKI